ncbi:MAG: hypothetical protein A2Z02_02255 [Chloroflexi bacterium RBG_16_48_7]|nr:MAG: hypothetical protein A2Z02_02255 [Chloroflexi bacterium RBG_16_48_7]
MRSAAKYALFLALSIVLIASSLSCITIKAPGKTGSQGGSSSSKTRPHPPVRTGDITIGPKVDLASQSVGPSGGIIAVAKPGDPMDGFVISVSPSSFSDSRNFKISSAPITKHSFGADINPVTPMISVENAGAPSDKLMYVRVPVKVPEQYFAMGFIYDEKSKQLEGMPLVSADSGSITVATKHFSNFFVSMIEKALLAKDTDSGFRPGIDDWEFVNNGSYIASGGHCEGQSLTAMWYYCTQPDGKDLCLFGRYDNNGKKPETPDLWEDDSFGYRFCSVIQADNKTELAQDFWLNLAGKNWVWINNKWEMKDVPGIGDGATFNLFSYSIRATGEPQEVAMWSSSGGGHAMVVYKAVGNALYVSDPNYPGIADRKIIYYSGEGKFKPYNSGANRKEIDAGRGTSFEKILYSGKSTVLPWDKIAQRWTEFKNGTIGNDKFPQYEIDYLDENNKWVPLVDGFSTRNKIMSLGVKRITGAFPLALQIYREGKQLEVKNREIELKPGNNELGIYVLGTINNEEQYVDFKYFNVKYEADEKCTPPPANIMSMLQKTTKFRCELLNLPTDIVGSGSMQKWVPGFKFTKHFYIPGNGIAMGGDATMPITWSGTNFSGGGSVSGYKDSLSGSVCYKDGQVLVSFDYANNDIKDNLKFSVKNLPCDPERLTRPASKGPTELVYMNTEAPVVKTYVSRLEWTSHEERRVLNGPNEVWDAYLKSADWTKQCGFDIFFR